MSSLKQDEPHVAAQSAQESKPAVLVGSLPPWLELRVVPVFAEAPPSVLPGYNPGRRHGDRFEMRVHCADGVFNWSIERFRGEGAPTLRQLVEELLDVSTRELALVSLREEPNDRA
jgi:DNA gyrase/topoisomerase IV subunit B